MHSCVYIVLFVSAIISSTVCLTKCICVDWGGGGGGGGGGGRERNVFSL